MCQLHKLRDWIESWTDTTRFLQMQIIIINKTMSSIWSVQSRIRAASDSGVEAMISIPHPPEKPTWPSMPILGLHSDHLQTYWDFKFIHEESRGSMDIDRTSARYGWGSITEHHGISHVAACRDGRYACVKLMLRRKSEFTKVLPWKMLSETWTGSNLQNLWPIGPTRSVTPSRVCAGWSILSRSK